MIVIDKDDVDMHKFLMPILTKEEKNNEYFKCKNYYEWYYTYGFCFHPKNMLEIGVGWGHSLISMMRGIQVCGLFYWIDNIYGIDNESAVPNSNATALSNVRTMFPDMDETLDHGGINIKLINKETSDVKRKDLDNIKFDLIHLDAQHNSNVILELELAWNVLNDKGIVIIDDVGSHWTNNSLMMDKRRTAEQFITKHTLCNKIEWSMYINTYRGHLLFKKR